MEFTYEALHDHITSNHPDTLDEFKTGWETLDPQLRDRWIEYGQTKENYQMQPAFLSWAQIKISSSKHANQRRRISTLPLLVPSLPPDGSVVHPFGVVMCPDPVQFQWPGQLYFNLVQAISSKVESPATCFGMTDMADFVCEEYREGLQASLKRVFAQNLANHIVNAEYKSFIERVHGALNDIENGGPTGAAEYFKDW